jgi:SAM-dependent methyltransferase
MRPDLPPANPWLSIPAVDYEAHMSSPQVRQLEYLSAAFAAALERHRPAGAIACLGCATGNGFEHLVGFPVQRVVAIDLNPEYLAILRGRYEARVRGLEVVCADLNRCDWEPGSFDLVWAGIVLEYVDHEALVEKISRWLRPEGVLAVVVQLPSPGGGHVTATPFRSLQALAPFMKLVAPERLQQSAMQQGLEMERQITRIIAGKEFYEADYRKRGGTGRA